MSIRAYKLKRVEAAKQSTFNLSNKVISQWLSNEIYEMGDGDCLSVEASCISEPLDDPIVAKEYGFGDEEMAIARQMLKDCDGNDFVEYWCY